MQAKDEGVKQISSYVPFGQYKTLKDISKIHALPFYRLIKKGIPLVIQWYENGNHEIDRKESDTKENEEGCKQISCYIPFDQYKNLKNIGSVYNLSICRLVAKGLNLVIEQYTEKDEINKDKTNNNNNNDNHWNDSQRSSEC